MFALEENAVRALALPHPTLLFAAIHSVLGRGKGAGRAEAFGGGEILFILLKIIFCLLLQGCIFEHITFGFQSFREKHLCWLKHDANFSSFCGGKYISWLFLLLT